MSYSEQSPQNDSKLFLPNYSYLLSSSRIYLQ